MRTRIANAEDRAALAVIAVLTQLGQHVSGGVCATIRGSTSAYTIHSSSDPMSEIGDPLLTLNPFRSGSVLEISGCRP